MHSLVIFAIIVFLFFILFSAPLSREETSELPSGVGGGQQRAAYEQKYYYDQMGNIGGNGDDGMQYRKFGLGSRMGGAAHVPMDGYWQQQQQQRQQQFRPVFHDSNDNSFISSGGLRQGERQFPEENLDSESLWTQLLKRLPESKLKKLHETACLLSSINLMEREGFLIMNPEATKWRKRQALRELQYILSKADPDIPNDRRITITEDMLNQFTLSDFYFHFKDALDREFVDEAVSTFASLREFPAKEIFNREGNVRKRAIEMEAASRNRRNTSEDHFIIQVKFPDGPLVTFINTKWYETIMAAALLSVSIINIFVQKSEYKGGKLRSIILWINTIMIIMHRFVLYRPSEKNLNEMFAFLSSGSILQIYAVASVHSPSLQDKQQLHKWSTECISHVLHFCVYSWVLVALLFHSYLIGSFAIFAFTCMRICDDIGYIESFVAKKLSAWITLKNAIFDFVYPQGSIMEQEGKRDIVPNILRSCLILMMFYWASILVRKIGFPYLLVFERALILHCCLVYYITVLIVSSKWYVSRKASIEQQHLQAEKKHINVSEQPVIIRERKTITKRHVAEENPESLIGAASGAGAYKSAQMNEAYAERKKRETKEKWYEIYVRTNLVAVGSSSVFIAIGYLLDVSFLFTITGYFFILLLILKYLEIFWKKENLVWTLLGLIALLYASSVMVKSLPSLYNPILNLIQYSWVMINTSAVTSFLR